MRQILHIGAEVSKDSSENLSEGLCKIFDSAHKNHIDQDNIKEAIRSFASVFKVEHVTVSNSSFTGEDKRVIVNQVEDEQEED